MNQQLVPRLPEARTGGAAKLIQDPGLRFLFLSSPIAGQTATIRSGPFCVRIGGLSVALGGAGAFRCLELEGDYAIGSIAV